MIPAAERAKVGVRAFAARSGKRPRRRWFPKTKTIVASDIEVTFDTETHIDAAQQLRVGGYTIHKADILKEAGLFYDPASLNRAELRTLHRFAKRHRFELLTDRQFVDRVIYGVAFRMNATLVGFNLSFDLSRLALGHGSARGTMRRGFTFALTDDPRWPNVQIKHLSNRSALIRFAAQRRQRTARSARKRQRPVPIRRGFFADVKTLAGTLVGGSHSLASLSRLLDTPEKKIETDEHGEELTEDYLEYLMRDVRVTRQCFVRLRNLFRTYRLTETPLTKLFSEASLGKALLKQMGIQGWRKLQSAFPRRSIGRIMATYYGGRSEVRDRRRVRRVLYVDFLSMYPTVCALMGLWRFVIAEGIRSKDATSEVRRLLARIELEDVREKDLWKALTTLVQVRPRADLFPVRSPYDGAQYTIGLNHLTSQRPMWFTLADCIVSTLLTGRAPEVLKALRYASSGMSMMSASPHRSCRGSASGERRSHRAPTDLLVPSPEDIPSRGRASSSKAPSGLLVGRLERRRLRSVQRGWIIWRDERAVQPWEVRATSYAVICARGRDGNG